MKEKDMITYLNLVRGHIFYKDGFWIYYDEEYSLVTSDFVREYIRNQGEILERDISQMMDELKYNNIEFNIETYKQIEIAKRGKRGTSSYFKSLDRLYPGNKFREIMNYYLFSNKKYCFVLVGYGQTGKTTFVNIIQNIIGEGFCGRSNVAMISGTHGTATLEGKLMFEVAEAQDLDINLANNLKSLITNDSITINPKFEHTREIMPHIKLIMTCNNVPRFKVSDDGIIRRFIVLEMNNKIKKQNENFMKEIEEDIPYIIYEAMLHPFNIDDFAKEQYYLFQHDPQYGFGYGTPNIEYDYGAKCTVYDSYRYMCKACGYQPKSKANFDKFVELAKMYEERALLCDTILRDVQEPSGINLLNYLEEEDLPF